jgi:predicted Zn-dependent protease
MSDTTISSELGAAEALMRSGSLDAAVKRLKTVLSKAPDNATALSYLALCLHDQGNSREALEVARAAVAAGRTRAWRTLLTGQPCVRAESPITQSVPCERRSGSIPTYVRRLFGSLIS